MQKSNSTIMNQLIEKAELLKIYLKITKWHGFKKELKIKLSSSECQWMSNFKAHVRNLFK